MKARACCACLCALLLIAAILWQLLSLFYSVQFKLRVYPVNSRYNGKLFVKTKATETLCERFEKTPIVIPASYNDVSDTVRAVINEEHQDFFLRELSRPAAAVIPKHIHQTYRKADKLGRLRQIPAKVALNHRMYAQGYNRTVYCDSEILAFLATYFTPAVVEAFKQVEGPHKSDIFRYAKLFVDGGIYLDIKTILIKKLDFIFRTSHKKPTTFVCMAYNRCLIYNGIIASPRHNQIFLKLLRHYVDIKKPIVEYQASNQFFYSLLSNGSNALLPVHGASGEKIFEYTFYEEFMRPLTECLDGPDKFGACFMIFDSHVPIFGVRYPDYPWDSNFW